jgi:TrmH family RNA methyltransferase
MGPAPGPAAGPRAGGAGAGARRWGGGRGGARGAAGAPGGGAGGAPHRPIALVFGREDAGLSNEDLDRCDRVLTIPADPRSSSLNLAQAALLVLYEIRLAASAAEPLPRPRRTAPPAATADMDALFRSWNEMLEAIDFFKTRHPPAILRTLRAVARRAGLDAREAKLLRAVAIEVRKTVSRLARRTPR